MINFVTELLYLLRFLHKIGKIRMAVAVDRGSLLIDHVVRTFRPIKDGLLAICIFYTAKNVVKLGYWGFQFIKNYSQKRSFTWHPRKILSHSHSKYGLVVLNTEILNQDRFIMLWNQASFRVLVDGAANVFFKLAQEKKDDIIKPIPDLVTGDFDSISPSIKKYYETHDSICKVIYAPCQNSTDFTKALQQVSLNIPNIKDIEEIYTFVEYGGRLDHIFSFFETLFEARNIPNLPPVFIVSSFTTDWLLQPGTHNINCHEKAMSLNTNSTESSQKRHCGIIPLGNPCTKIKTSGLKWNICDKQTLAFGTLISTSNEYIDTLVTIEVETPVIWTMENYK